MKNIPSCPKAEPPAVAGGSAICALVISHIEKLFSI
jgi:hypothetical protein